MLLAKTRQPKKRFTQVARIKNPFRILIRAVDKLHRLQRLQKQDVNVKVKHFRKLVFP